MGWGRWSLQQAREDPEEADYLERPQPFLQGVDACSSDSELGDLLIPEGSGSEWSSGLAIYVLLKRNEQWPLQVMLTQKKWRAWSLGGLASPWGLSTHSSATVRSLLKSEKRHDCFKAEWEITKFSFGDFKSLVPKYLKLGKVQNPWQTSFFRFFPSTFDPPSQASCHLRMPVTNHLERDRGWLSHQGCNRSGRSLQ